MPNNYDFLDAHSSILTARSSVTSGSAVEPFVIVSSILSPVPVTFSSNASVSGTVGASIVGQLPAGTAVIGSVMVLQGTNPWNVGSVYGNVSGSVLSQQLGVRTSSVVSDVPSSMLVGASIFGQLPAGTAMIGSVVAYPGAVWPISSVYGNISGSVLSQQLGAWVTSVLNSIPSSLLTGSYGHRNDAVASFLGGDLSWRPFATDSAGRTLTKPMAAEESRVEGYSSTVNTSQTTLIAAAGTGLKNYITDIWFANTGSVSTLITFKDGAGSVLGYTIAPSGSGSNLPGLVTPIRTGANATFDFQASTGVSVLYATVKGFKAP